MKLTKLSLAAMVALGAFSVSASAVSLEEAIKNVNVDGFARYRYDYEAVDDNSSRDSSVHKVKFGTTFTTAIDDNFFATVELEYGDSKDKGRKAYLDSNGSKSIDEDFIKAKTVAFGAKFGNTSVTFGRQEVGAFFTDDLYGAGIVATNSDIQGLTLAAMFFDSLSKDGDIAATDINDRDLFGIAAIGSYDPVGFQLWYANLKDAAALYAVEASLGLDFDPIALGVTAQYGGSSIGDDLDSNIFDDGSFVGVQVDVEGFGAYANLGYVMFDTDEGKTSLVSYEDNGKFIDPGEEFGGKSYNRFKGDNNFFFVGAGYTFADAVTVGAEYLSGENDNGSKTDYDELVVRGSYSYNSKLKFSTFYSMYSKEPDGGEKEESSKFRLEAKYTF